MNHIELELFIFKDASNLPKLFAKRLVFFVPTE